MFFFHVILITFNSIKSKKVPRFDDLIIFYSPPNHHLNHSMYIVQHSRRYALIYVHTKI